MWFGSGLRGRLIVEAGDYLSIPGGTPYHPANPSAAETCVAVFARTDPYEQESVVLVPELEPVEVGAGDEYRDA